MALTSITGGSGGSRFALFLFHLRAFWKFAEHLAWVVANAKPDAKLHPSVSGLQLNHGKQVVHTL